VRRVRHLDHPSEVGDGFPLDDQLLGSFELADGLIGCVSSVLYGNVRVPVFPDQEFHSPWTAFPGSMSIHKREQQCACY
jgi:hypothetical protein